MPRVFHLLLPLAFAAAALPALAGEKEFRDCTAAMAAGRPYPGVQQQNVDFVREDAKAIAQARAAIKALTEEKLTVETLAAFFEEGSPNYQKIKDRVDDLRQNLTWQNDNIAWFEVSAKTVTEQSCAFTRQSGGFGTSAVLEMSGQPVTSGFGAPWTVVAPGQIEQHAYGYGATYTWSTLPYHIGPEGFDLTLTVVAQCSNGQRLSTGINLRGGFDFVRSASDTTNVPTDLAAYCENNSDRQTLSVHVKPAKTYGAGQDVVITIGAFYGPSVTYHFKPVRTGN